MAAPAVLGLGRALPEWDWHLLGNSKTLPLYRGLDLPFHHLPWVSDSPSRPGFIVRTAAKLRRIGFHAAVVLPPSFSSAMMASLAGIPLRVGRGSGGRGFLFSGALPPGVRTHHLAGQYCEVAEALLDRIAPQDAPWSLPAGMRRLPLRPEEMEWADRWYAEAGLDPARTLFLAPGATYGATKRWPPERFASLGSGLAREGWGIVILGGREEQAAAAGLAGTLRTSHDRCGQVISTAGTLSLRESMSLLAQGRAAVSNDSGAMHLAQAAGCPVVGIFGSTSPRWTGPVGRDQRTVYRGLPCSPCFSRECPTMIECLGDIPAGEVRSALDDLLEETAAGSGRPAVFLDRDGTVLELVPYLNRADQVRLAPGAGAALRRLRTAGFALVVATNQSAVARGLLDTEGLRRIHLRMDELLRREGVQLDAIEFCPHHPDYTGACACRKPRPGMLRRSAHALDLDLRQSFMIGDNRPDIEAGRNAGVRTVLLRTGHGLEAGQALKAAGVQEDPDSPTAPRPDAVLDDLASAADWILSRA